MNPSDEVLSQKAWWYGKMTLLTSIIQKELLELSPIGAIDTPNPVEPPFPWCDATLRSRNQVGEDMAMGHLVEGESVLQFIHDLRSHIALLHNTTPCDVTHILRPDLRKQNGSAVRMNAIGTDEEIGIEGFPGFELCVNGAVVLIE
jgi:hypothetical protein